MEERLCSIEPQSMDLSAMCLEGLTLDVGGGGEGVIAQCKREEIVVIDRKKEELLEAPAYGLKIVMDAKDLQFLDNTFDTATSFFTMLYMPGEEDHKGAFQEIYRVLKDSGEFLLLRCCYASEDHRERYFCSALGETKGEGSRDKVWCLVDKGPRSKLLL